MEAAAQRRGRLRRAERERQILNEAISFFAERGFSGQTRELAKRLGVTQPLLYRYFPTKADLIQRVYEEVYLSRWDPAWPGMITDRSINLRDRLVRFYTVYFETIFSSDWMRIYMFSGLHGEAINEQYIAHVEKHLLTPTIAEMRAERGLPGPNERPIDPMELEVAWNAQSGIFYYGIRRYVYGIDIKTPLTEVIETNVDVMLCGAAAVTERTLSQNPAN
ncbi:MAG: helix-turn-helix domain-containing protein [Pseudomonadota bacterium]